MNETNARVWAYAIIIGATMLGFAHLLATIATNPVNMTYVAIYTISAAFAFYQARHLVP